MLGSVCEVVILKENGLREIIAEVNKEYNTFQGQEDWYDPDDFYYLFWDEQEFGTNCYMMLNVSDETITREKDYLRECEEAGDPDALLLRVRVRVLEYIRQHIPPYNDTVIVPILY